MSNPAVETEKKTVNPLIELEQQGQAVWLDYIRRTLLTSGELKRLVDEDGLSGVTSNPTIFEKAIGGSSDYDDALGRALKENAHSSSAALFDGLAIEDIQGAADVLRPVYDRTKGADGFISMEVSPDLAHDTEGSMREARRLWKAVNRPNLLVKIPATPEGIPAIEGLLAEGINVNITLMFSMAHYEAVANAYLKGLERCKTPERMASVASFFVSRVDNLADPALEKIGTPEALALRGKIGIANSRVVYQRFREIFDGPQFAGLRAKGARVQRVLWASTSTKNPAYRDVLYVEELIGPDTVDTIPPATLKAFREHGKVRGSTIVEGVEQARADLAAFKKVGGDLDAITAKLQTDGVASFSESFRTLMEALEKKRRTLRPNDLDQESQNVGAIDGAVNARLEQWKAADFGRRFWAKDPLLWLKQPAPEITDRMGWLNLPEVMHEQVGNLLAFAKDVKSDGYRHAVLLGMGGSSLAPEVFQRTFGNAAGYPELLVLDSTHPDAVRAMHARIDVERTLFIVSSKSGTTTEMLSFFYYFWAHVSARSKTPGRQFVAVTDPETPLVKLAKDRGFRRVFEATPDVGGRYSALTYFGLVPAAVMGVDLRRLLDVAWSMQEACASFVTPADNPGMALGAALGEAALAGRDKVTFFTSAGISAFPTWVEQLIAESTGKDDKGIVPVADEPLGAPAVYGKDRLFVHLALEGEADESSKHLADLEAAGNPVVRIKLAEVADIAQEFYRWEVAVAAAGAVMGIHPFNQPDVQLAKSLAHKAMEQRGKGAAGQGGGAGKEIVAVTDDAGLKKAVKDWLGGAHEGDYIGIDAYVAPSAEISAALEKLRVKLRDQTHLATMLGYGPRFLHSTGQLHKGGPNTGMFLQLLQTAEEDVAVPETDYTFGALIQAQALGDYGALEQRGRRTLRVQLGADVAAGLARIIAVLGG